MWGALFTQRVEQWITMGLTIHIYTVRQMHLWYQQHFYFFSGLSADALNQIPSDVELLRFSTNCTIDQIKKLVSYLELSKQWEEIEYNNPKNIAVVKFLVLSKWKEEEGMKFKDLKKALTEKKISTHVLCQVRSHKYFVMIRLISMFCIFCKFCVLYLKTLYRNFEIL